MIQKTFTVWPRVLSCIAILATTTLAGCNEPDPPTASSSPTTSGAISEAVEEGIDDTIIGPSELPTTAPSTQAASSSAGSILSNTIVSEQGLGVAQLGMTLADLKQALPDLEFSPQSPFIVDFDAIAVRKGEETLFYILHLAGSPLTDSDRIRGLITDHPMFKTAEDVGVGTPIHAAEVPYGKAVLSYNTDNESREYVRFENHPASNISFGTQKNVIDQDGSSLGLEGIYDTQASQYNETDLYQADATIEAILIICLSATCSE